MEWGWHPAYAANVGQGAGWQEAGHQQSVYTNDVGQGALGSRVSMAKRKNIQIHYALEGGEYQVGSYF